MSTMLWNRHKKSDKELMELGQKLQMFYDMGYVSKKQALGFTFLKGIIGGAGAFIGGTLIIALLLWGLSLLDETPFIGDIIQSIQQNLQK